jgi:aerotolerance regulator-like protein
VIFLHPLALIGLAAAAIPALLHLFQRRQPPEADFPALRYLSEAERRSARRMRLRHLLLLLLRTGLIVAVILAAARPLVPSRSSGATHPPSALVIVLDNSLSSGAVVGGQVTLDRLKAAARAVLRRATPDDRLWLVLADGIVRSGAHGELEAAVDSAPADARRLDLVSAVTRAVRVAAAAPAPVREVHVISDLQRTALASGRVTVPPGVRILALAPRPTPANRGIAAARVAGGGGGEGGAVSVTVVGTAGASPVPVTLRLRGRDLARGLAAPGATVTLPFADPGPGWWVGEVSLEPDELRSDDRRLVVWHSVPPARVRADPAAGPFAAAALAVLQAAHRVSDGVEVTLADRPGAGASVVVPPADPALIGQVNRALQARGTGWHFGGAGSPGPIASTALTGLDGARVTRRQRLEGADSGLVLATVNGEPWAVASGGVVLLGSRFDTTWTTLPTTPAFVPLVDALVNRFSRGESPVMEQEGDPRVTFARVGPDTVGATVYGPDPRESDLTPADPAVVRSVLGAELVRDVDFGAAAFAGLRRADLSGMLLLIALLLALGELAAATLAR